MVMLCLIVVLFQWAFSVPKCSSISFGSTNSTSDVNQRWGTTGYILLETDPLLAGTRCPDQLREPDSTRMGWTHSGVEWPVQYIKR
jgi:hypothetical protein